MTDFRRTIVAGSVPLVFGVGFVQLGRLFDYPQILRQSSEMILERFRANESIIAPWWWLMFVAALAFIPVSVAVVRWSGLRGTHRAVATSVGVASGLVQAFGLSRWVFAVPLLAERAADPSQAKTATLLFDLLHVWLGVGLGEWAGYFFTALWTAIVAFSYYSRARFLAVSGLVISFGIGFGMLEVFGLSSAGLVNALAYSLWVPWMLGVAWRLGRTSSTDQTTINQ